MPTYQYACTECGRDFEVVQAFTDDALTECEVCNGRLRKVFGSVGIVFKGSGFYRTDSRQSTDGAADKAGGEGSDKAPAADKGGKDDKASDGKGGASTADKGSAKGPDKDGKKKNVDAAASSSAPKGEKPGSSGGKPAPAKSSSTAGSAA